MLNWNELPADDDSFLIDFINKFSGDFGIDIVNNNVFYMSNEKQPYNVLANNKEQFYSLLKKSLKDNINYFLESPIKDDLPEGAIK